MNPLIRNLGLGIGGASIAVAIYFSAVTGASYPSAILMHLTDIIHGNQTTAVVATNAPNWSIGEPLVAPVASSIATSSYGSAASGLASSTPYTFSVAALDGNGTTSLQTFLTQTTDASTTQNNPEVINIKWQPVVGATGYAVYFGTTTTQTAASLTQYFYATTSSQYTFSTSTASLAGSYTREDTTAFATLFNPVGPDWINGSNVVSTATTSPVASSTALQVNGNLLVNSVSTTSQCYAALNGAMFYSAANQHLWICQGAGPTWTVIK